MWKNEDHHHQSPLGVAKPGWKKGLQAENKVVHPAMVVHLHQHWASVAEHVVHHWEHRCLCLRVVVIMVEL